MNSHISDITLKILVCQKASGREDDPHILKTTPRAIYRIAWLCSRLVLITYVIPAINRQKSLGQNTPLQPETRPMRYNIGLPPARCGPMCRPLGLLPLN